MKSEYVSIDLTDQDDNKLAGDLYLEAEKDIRRVTLGKRHRRYEPNSVTFVTKDNFTEATIWVEHWKRGILSGTGFSKRRPTDPYDKLRGYKVAMKRAIEDAING